MNKIGMKHQDKYELIHDQDNYQLIDAFQADFFAKCTIEKCWQRGKVYFRSTNKKGEIMMIGVPELYNEKRMRRKAEALTGKSMPCMDKWDLGEFTRKIMAASLPRPEMQPPQN